MRAWTHYVIIDRKYQGGASLEALKIARIAVDAAIEKQATNIVLLDIREQSSFADYFVICSGSSERQLQALLEEIGHKLKAAGVQPSHVEGTSDSGWVLLDYGDVIIHIFNTSERDFYNLDELWGKAAPVLKVQ